MDESTMDEKKSGGISRQIVPAGAEEGDGRSFAQRGKTPCLEVHGLEAHYSNGGENILALAGVDLSLDRGQMGVIIGPSGSGKSTLLMILAGLNKNYRGEVRIDGRDPASGGKTSLILQDFGLLPWKTVAENIGLGLKLRKVDAPVRTARVEALLTKMGLLPLAKRFPARLSGGQRQRVAIARSLVLEPNLLLMDEPFSSLDALTREDIQDFLLEIWRDTGLTTLLITHSIEEAVFLGQKIFIMSPGPGRIVKTVQNPLAGNAGLRGKVAFLEMCSDLRSYLHPGKKGEEEDVQKETAQDTGGEPIVVNGQEAVPKETAQSTSAPHSLDEAQEGET